MVAIDPSNQAYEENYRTIISATTPRPIGWISTVSSDGIDNLAPFSHFNNLCPSPPVVMFSTGVGDDDELKDTARNALDTGEFVVNVVTEALADQMNRTADEIPSEESEFDCANVTRAESDRSHRLALLNRL